MQLLAPVNVEALKRVARFMTDENCLLAAQLLAREAIILRSGRPLLFAVFHRSDCSFHHSQVLFKDVLSVFEVVVQWTVFLLYTHIFRLLFVVVKRIFAIIIDT